MRPWLSKLARGYEASMSSTCSIGSHVCTVRRSSCSLTTAAKFTGRLMDMWAYHHGVRLDFSRPGKPTDNGFVESFNGSLRDECLNLHWFATITEARGSWRLGGLTVLSVTARPPNSRVASRRWGLPNRGRNARCRAPPRTDPYVRHSRIRLLPRVGDGEANIGPRMKDARRRQPRRHEPSDAAPRHRGLLTAPPKRAPPEFGDVIAEGTKSSRVRGHRVVGEVARHHGLQPAPLFGDRVVHAATQLHFDFLQFRSHAIASRFAPE